MSPIFCPDDIIAKRASPTTLGVIERTHSDVDTHTPYPGHSEPARIKCDKSIASAAFTHFMKDGIPPKETVLVRWQASVHASLIREAKLELVDRSLLVGDVVRRGVGEAMSGVVVSTFTMCDLLPLGEAVVRMNGGAGGTARLRGLLPPAGIRPRFEPVTVSQPPLVKNVPSSELLCYPEGPNPEDLVLYQGWLGRVEDVTTAVSLKLSDNGVVELSDEDCEHLDGSYENFHVGDIACTKKGFLRAGKWVYGRYNPNTTPLGTVVASRIVTAHVTWLERRIGGQISENEPNAELDRLDLESASFHVYDRSRRPPGPANSNSGAIPTLSNSEEDVRLNLRARFRDLSGACVKYSNPDPNGAGKVPRIDRRDTLGYDLNVFDIVKFRTDATVQWQDLSLTRERSIDLIPELELGDEHEAWPGEIVHPVTLDAVPGLPGVSQARKAGVVQSVDAAERMAKVRWCADSCVQFVEEKEESWMMGATVRRVVSGVVGCAEGEMEEVSLYDVEAPGDLNVRRGDLVLISDPSWMDGGGGREWEWLGEIVDTPLDASLTIRFGAADTVRDVSFRREQVVVAYRSDRSDEIDEVGDEEEDAWNVRINSDGEIETFGEDESEEESDGDSSVYSFVSASDEQQDAWYENENGELMDPEDVEDEDWESDVGEDGSGDDDIEMRDAQEAEVTPLTSQSPTPPDTTRSPHHTSSHKAVGDEHASPNNNNNTANTAPDPPPPYLILEGSHPPTHAFATRLPPTDTAHTKRVAKEHRILRTPTNLPPGIYVRTWETRLDLLRVLFLGPSGTPYANAPFVIDFCLPATFPSSPPLAFFHSWPPPAGLPGVIGRVNPNLYEDGKICLSLLGTWESEGKSEGWSAGRSTLLQVLVSLLGLVLVREPYFNEAGYEHLVGLETARRGSVVYSERVFLKCRGFVVVALSRSSSSSSGLGDGGEVVGESAPGMQGLEDVVGWCFCDSRGPGLLGRNLRDVEELLRRGESGVEGGGKRGGGEDYGLEVVSKGACVSLRRILEQLSACVG